jgi:hypothetical protein
MRAALLPVALVAAAACVAGAIVGVIAIARAVLEDARTPAVAPVAVRQPDQAPIAPARPAVANPAAKAQPQDKWTDARTGEIVIGDVAVRVTGATFQRSDIYGVLPKAREYLFIRLSVENRSETRKVDCEGWDTAIFDGGAPKLSDEHGNTYDRWRVGAEHATEQPIRRLALYPGKTAKDCLRFQVPVSRATVLSLELPGDAVGANGVFRFRLPVEMIQR